MIKSRRMLLKGLASITAAGLGRSASGQGRTQGSSLGGPRLRPLKEFRGAFFRALSADGEKMCAVVAPDGVEASTYREGEWSRDDASTVPQGASLCVVDLGSWSTIYSTK